MPTQRPSLPLTTSSCPPIQLSFHHDDNKRPPFRESRHSGRHGKKKQRASGGKKKKPKVLGELVTAPFSYVLEGLGVRTPDWDLALVGDGSGTTWQTPCGWSCILVNRHGRSKQSKRKVFYGGMSCGTVNLAELLPYLQALLFFEVTGAGPDLQRDLRRPLNVHVITDSKLSSDQGNRLCRRSCNQEVWAAFDVLETKGYRLHWHWQARDSTGLNMLTDHLSRSARKSASQAANLPAGTSAHSYNPDNEDEIEDTPA